MAERDDKMKLPDPPRVGSDEPSLTEVMVLLREILDRLDRLGKLG